MGKIAIDPDCRNYLLSLDQAKKHFLDDWKMLAITSTGRYPVGKYSLFSRRL